MTYREAKLDDALLAVLIAILHFYLDEVGMEFWSAHLFKKL